MDPLAALAALAAAASEAKIIPDAIDTPVSSVSDAGRYRCEYYTTSAVQASLPGVKTLPRQHPPRSIMGSARDVRPIGASSDGAISAGVSLLNGGCDRRQGGTDNPKPEPRPSLAKYMASLGKGPAPKPRRHRQTAYPSNAASSAQISDFSDESAAEQEVAPSTDGRPKRQSAKAARDYLQRVMQHKGGRSSGKDGAGAGSGAQRAAATESAVPIEVTSAASSNGTGGKSRKRSPSPVTSGGAETKRQKTAKDEPTKRQAGRPPKVTGNTESSAVTSPDHCSVVQVVSNESSKCNSPEGGEAGTEATCIRSSDDEQENELKEALPFAPVTSDNVRDGSRVFIEHRDILYKATVRKTKTVPQCNKKAATAKRGIHGEVEKEKGESSAGDKKQEKAKGQQQYLIHYDGNKKSNVHWLPFDQIKGLIKDEDMEWPPPAKPAKALGSKGKEQRKSEAEGTKTAETSAPNTREEAEQFSIGKDVFIEHEGQLFRATVLKRRIYKGVTQYRVHWEGYTKRNDCWIKGENVHKITCYTSRRFNKEQKLTAAKEDEEVEEEEEEEDEEEEEEEQAEEVEDEVEEEDGMKEDFTIGNEVYVEYKDVLYRATILKERQRKGTNEFFVHYDGFKKTSDKWVKDDQMHKITAYTSRRFNKQRREAAENAASGNAVTEVAKRKGKTRSIAPSASDAESDGEVTIDLVLDGIISGVEFLRGSSIFVFHRNALYLAKMLKRRIRSGESQFFIHYNGFRDSSNTWVSVDNVYEINPQTRKIFEMKDTGQIRSKPAEEALKKAAAAAARKQRPVGNQRKGSRLSSVASEQAFFEALRNVDSGVDFLPGSTLFANIKNALHLAKMVKKRAQNGAVEYMIHYVHKKRTNETWISVEDVYEINPQTKRVFGKFKAK